MQNLLQVKVIMSNLLQKIYRRAYRQCEYTSLLNFLFFFNNNGGIPFFSLFTSWPDCICRWLNFLSNFSSAVIIYLLIALSLHFNSVLKVALITWANFLVVQLTWQNPKKTYNTTENRMNECHKSHVTSCTWWLMQHHMRAANVL